MPPCFSVLLEVPIVVNLPALSAAGLERHLLLTVTVRMFPSQELQAHVVWDEFTPAFPAYGRGRTAPMHADAVDGARIVCSTSPMSTPTYVVVTHLPGVDLPARLLIELLLSEDEPGAPNTMRVLLHMSYMPVQECASSRSLPIFVATDETICGGHEDDSEVSADLSGGDEADEDVDDDDPDDSDGSASGGYSTGGSGYGEEDGSVTRGESPAV